MSRLLLFFSFAIFALAQTSEVFEGDLNGAPITYRIAGGYAVFQDDIILGPAEKPTGQRNTSFSTGNLWLNGLVPYEVDPSIPVATSVQIQLAVDTWNSYGTPIHLQPRAGEVDYVRFVKPAAVTGACSSSVGRIGGGQVVSLEDGCAAPTIIHELGHAIGMWHEQSRSDRNASVTVLYENIAKDRAGNYSIVSQSQGQDIGGYEYSSSMHYTPFSFSVDGRQTMESVPPGIPMGTGAGMNAGDLDAVSRKYGVIPTQTTIAANPPGLMIEVDGDQVVTPRVFSWAPGSQHLIAVPETPQKQAAPQYVYAQFVHGKWSDGGAQSHVITAGPDATVFTANFIRRVPVTLPQLGLGVSVSPASSDGYYATYTQIRVTAEPPAGSRFLRWLSSGPFACGVGRTTSTNPLVLPASFGTGCVAQFTQSPITTIDSDPPGQTVTVDGFQYAAPMNFAFVAGSLHTIAAPAPAAGAVSRLLFSGWSDDGAATHIYTARPEGGTVTARFTRQYLLMLTQPSSTSGRIFVSPTSPDGFYDAGTVVEIQAQLNTGRSLFIWTGDLVGRTNPATLVMDDQHLVGAFIVTSTTIPVVTTLNSLSFQYTPLSPGQIVSIFGTNMGPEGGVGPVIDGAGRVGTESGKTKVWFDGVPAPIVYASSQQVNVVVPYALAGTFATRLVTEYNGVQTSPVFVPMAPVNPTIVSTGTGYAAVVNQDGSINAPNRPAKRGSVIVFFATGEGGTDPVGVDGRVGVVPLAKPVAPVFVRIGGRPAEVLYAGNAPNFVAGAMQVNVRIPDDAPSGDVSLYLIVGSTASPPVTKVSVE